ARPRVERVMTVVVASVFFLAIVLAGWGAWVTGSAAFGTPDLNGTIALAYFGGPGDDEEVTQ
ncbi:MAG: hypothetical protein ACR2NG_06940, partial [Acidimicrobiia bacterium]